MGAGLTSMGSIEESMSTQLYTSASLRRSTMLRLRSHIRPGRSIDSYLNELMDDDLSHEQRFEVARREREETSIPWRKARRSLPVLARHRARR